jgi:hypothetical protein
MLLDLAWGALIDFEWLLCRNLLDELEIVRASSPVN